mmetsp:Transcript_16975/g.18899  ORF Transcript_16975/g.18899 Transcript_16975/m.18899 type:complete len:535 (+) Transcript_16975:138-1742(+)
MTLVNQSCSALLYEGLQTLSAVGIKIQVGSHALDEPAVRIITEDTMPVDPKCAVPATNNPQKSPPALSGQLSLVDSSIEYLQYDKSCVSIITARDLYMQNVYIKNCENLVSIPTLKYIAESKYPDSWTKVNEYAKGVKPPIYATKGKKFQYESPTYLNGKRSFDEIRDILYKSEPPSDLQEQHLWNFATFPSFQSSSVVNVKLPPYNAKGDGLTDDTRAIQDALDQTSNGIVFLPKGYYRISKTLKMAPGQSLIGIARHLTFIAPVTEGVGGAIVETSNSQNIIAFLSVKTYQHLKTDYAIHWLAKSDQSIYRQAHTDRAKECWELMDILKIKVPCKNATNITVPLNFVSGSGRFYNFYQENWQYQDPGSRHLQLVNASNIRCYQCNTEHGRGDTNFEISNSHHIDIYGVKSEGNFPVLWIKDSNFVSVYGYGGNAAALPNNTHYPPGYSMIAPTLFRVENTPNYLLANLWDYGRIDGGNWFTFPGIGVNPKLWNIAVDINNGDEIVPACPSPHKGELFTCVLDRPVVMKRSTS